MSVFLSKHSSTYPRVLDATDYPPHNILHDAQTLYYMMLCATRNIMNLYMQQLRNFVVGCKYHSPPTVTACVSDVVPFIDPSP
ncbi:hypothetical protein BDR04DRAFT_1097481 [Suillus decipiens]|nr:hypothetical protein BDR04DRAFT_1097481 [Suillus decipiens]